jgi:peptidoglycan/LPS O-acetylase OafA/YrhL
VLGLSNVLQLSWLERSPLWGDFSYGVYIIAFPIQQIVARTIGGDWAVNFGVSLIVVLALAAASWHFVEKKFLRLKSRHRSGHKSALAPAKPTGGDFAANGLGIDGG